MDKERLAEAEMAAEFEIAVNERFKLLVSIFIAKKTQTGKHRSQITIDVLSKAARNKAVD